MKLWLIGMMGSGKTTAGCLAAVNLGVPFLDTDALVTERTGRSIAELWSEDGEVTFRIAERQIIAETEGQDGIVSTGGGVVLDAANREVLTRSGTVVWIDASPRVLAARLATSDDRPLLSATGEATESILSTTLSEREYLYAGIADHRVVTDDLDTAATAARIEALWNP